MNVVDVFEYKRAKEKKQELEDLLKQFDSISDMLYDNLRHTGIWDLVQHVEELRVQYYVEYYEWDQILRKGSTHDKN